MDVIFIYDYSIAYMNQFFSFIYNYISYHYIYIVIFIIIIIFITTLLYATYTTAKKLNKYSVQWAVLSQRDFLHL